MAEIIPPGATRRKRAHVSMGMEDSDRDRAHLEGEVDWFFENASPNPDRVGCPSGQAISELAHRIRPISDPGYDHLAHCSPCYQQFRRLQGKNPTSPTSQASRRILAVAAGIVLIAASVAVVWWFRWSSTGPNQATKVAVLDLRNSFVTRGTQSDGLTPIRLPRADIRAEILLPVGFEPGHYDLRLANSALVTVLSIEADAVLRNQSVTIHTTMKLSDLQAGPYQLALRRLREDWHFFPITLD